MILRRGTLEIVLVTLLLAMPAHSACGFCATEVTLSRSLAECYLTRLETELDKAQSANLDVHLVELAACGNTRGSLPMPKPQIVGSEDATRVLDQTFFISVPAMTCLAKKLREATFDEQNETVRVEVRDDC